MVGQEYTQKDIRATVISQQDKQCNNRLREDLNLSLNNTMNIIVFSIKLMPTKKEAWDALGHVYWKKNDLEQSYKCFESSLEQDDTNIEILRNMSMVCRQQKASDEPKRKANFKKSIELATKAVSLNMKDSQSWCKSYFKSFDAESNLYEKSSLSIVFQMSLEMPISQTSLQTEKVLRS